MYLFFDTETTGLPKNYNAPIEDLDNWPRLVQLAWQLYNKDGELVSEKECIIKPEGFIIPEQSSNVHGITTERAISEGVDLTSSLAKFSQAIEDSLVLVAHNINFDEKIIGSEFLRKGIDNNLKAIPKICTMQTTTDLCKIPGSYGRYKWPKLSELHIELFGKDFEDAHDALVDVKACARCFFQLKDRGIL